MNTNKKLSYRRGNAWRTISVAIFLNCCTAVRKIAI